jgi:hypothetical protein
MLIVFLLRKILSETIKLSGASRRCSLAFHGHLHPSQIISSRACEQRCLRMRRRDSDRRHGYMDLHLVDEVANRMIIAAASDCLVCPPPQPIESSSRIRSTIAS